MIRCPTNTGLSRRDVTQIIESLEERSPISMSISPKLTRLEGLPLLQFELWNERAHRSTKTLKSVVIGLDPLDARGIG